MRMERNQVIFDGSDFDVSSFLKNHPGGVNYVQPYFGKEVRKRMEDTQHSRAAFYLLREYKSGGREDRRIDENEDLEKLVDWNKPMLRQVVSLGDKYHEWVISPVDRKLRLFGSPILEMLTITPWYVVPVFWVPIILYFIYEGTQQLSAKEETSLPFTVSYHLVLGIVLWSLLEYSLHRWVFHMKPSGSNKIMIYVHFAIHGLHHKVPFDSRRLVFPPFPAAVIAFTIYKLLIAPFVSHPYNILLLAGGLIGYLIYDMIHFYLHYGSPEESNYFYHLKRYHNQHHFAHHDSGFGISSTFWDRIFGTSIALKKLAMSIKW